MRRSVWVSGFMWVLGLLCALSGYAQIPPGPMSKEHGMLSGPEHCNDCHDLAGGKPEFKCLSCHSGIPEDQKSGRHLPLGDAITNGACAGCHSLHSAGGTASGETEKKDVKAGSPHGSAGIACRNCHTATSFRPIRPFPDFTHSQTRFPLRGMHVGLDCRQCHAKLVFTSVGKQCADCHADFHRRQMGSNCEQCHTVRGWRVTMTAVNNHANRFPLLGAHAAVDCQSCHKSAAAGQRRGLNTDCVSCHQRDYAAAKSADHQAAGFPTTCQSCHTGMDSWARAKFDHNQSGGFPLTGGHAQLDCTACHQNRKFTGTSSDCISCHAADYSTAANPNHTAAGFSRNCLTCHSTAGWAASIFDHGTSAKFMTTGAHTSVDCQACHKNGKYAGTPTSCYSCHAADYNAAKSPVHANGTFSTDCTTCHTSASWRGGKLDHNLSNFRLTGAHASVQCAACHKNNVYTGLSTDCASCHLNDYNRTTNPNHVSAGFPQDCSQCHNSLAWQGGTSLNHNTQTKFPLTGAHVGVQCTTCHKNNVFAGTSTACVSCHLITFNGTTNPNHASAGFSQQCSTCHNSTTSWASATFNHTATAFALTGAHIGVQCATCHKNSVYAGLPKTCASCHLNDYNRTANPNHASAGFPQDCSQCHNSLTWQGGTSLNHNTQTKFALTGAHVGVQCTTCHKNNVYAGLPTTCVSCHLTDYNGVTNPNHVSAGFSQQCSTCHNSTNSWAGATFNHSTTTFPLTGAHTGVLCTTCHKNNVYAGLPTTCVSCHLTDYNGVTNPNHVSAGFSQQCSTCHNSMTSWAGATFNHSTTTFALTGSHVGVLCTTCHKNNVYKGLPTTCVSCHLTDYNGVTNPNHAAAGFSQQCSTCHNSMTSWAGATFNHSTTTFPLTGAHTSALCTTCHKNNVYKGLPTTCVSCHLTDYNGVTNPNHVSAGFPQQCSTCHNSTTSWAGATFNHSTTTFPLTGAHTSALCTTCHKNNVYAGLPSTCVSCHLAGYNGTTNPNHVQSGFPQDCSLCHSTASFSGATFHHGTTPFPLTGAHVTVSCTTCHKNNVYAGLATACSSCHLTDYNGTTNPNHKAAGFPQLCSTCHSTTSWAGATFNHTATRFPLTGAHTSVQCNLCHINNKYVGTPTDCYSCHSAEYRNTTNPGHQAAGFPTTCATCHSTTLWTGATFNHTWFSTRHGGATRTCSDCHTNPSNYSIFTCTTCHTKAQMDNKHAGRSGYVYNSANCYQCHRSGGN